GLGLGLAIVRHLVEMHGGTVHADSAGECQGATFTVLLPFIEMVKSTDSGSLENIRMEAAPAEGRHKTGDGNPLGGVRVLVVDDEAGVREMLKLMLEHRSVEVRTAGS